MYIPIKTYSGSRVKSCGVSNVEMCLDPDLSSSKNGNQCVWNRSARRVAGDVFGMRLRDHVILGMWFAIAITCFFGRKINYWNILIRGLVTSDFKHALWLLKID